MLSNERIYFSFGIWVNVINTNYIVVQVSAGYLVCISISHPQDLGLIRRIEILRSLSWFGHSSTPMESLPLLTPPLAETANVLQCLALSMDEQYAILYNISVKYFVCEI